MNDLRDALARAAGPPAGTPDLPDLRSRAERRRRTRRRRAALTTAVVVAMIAGGSALAVARARHDDAGRVTTRPIEGAPSPGWSDLPASPLAGRKDAGLFWTGEEVLVVGGSDDLWCPPGADCLAPVGVEATRDGAAYDPGTQTWRRIADAPVPFSRPDGIMHAGSLYLLVEESYDGNDRDRFLRYDIEADKWSDLEGPGLLGWRHLLIHDGRLVAYLGSEEATTSPSDLVWDPDGETWSRLPEDPLPRMFDRSVFSVDGRLYVFGHDLRQVAEDHTGVPLLEGAVYDGDGWERLPTSSTVGYGGLQVGDLILSPAEGEPDGGGVGNWGRPYPERWLFDTRTDTWEEMPQPPPRALGAPVEPSGASALIDWVAGSGKLVAGDAVFDVPSRTWTRLTIPAELTREGMRAVWAGDRLVMFGGVTIADPYEQSELHADLWQWVPPD